jgi:O-acetyl-ADP-ribose deacetylase (regulator of RNase III)
MNAPTQEPPLKARRVPVTEIEYIKGDMFKQIARIREGEIMIPHCCNDIGAWGAGFVLPLAKEFPKARSGYLEFYKTRKEDRHNHKFELGATQIIEVDVTANRIVLVANMIGQRGVRGPLNPVPVDYDALEKCIEEVSQHCDENTLIFAPKFGAGLAGGKWDKIEPMILKHWVGNDIRTKVFSL